MAPLPPHVVTVSIRSFSKDSSVCNSLSTFFHFLIRLPRALAGPGDESEAFIVAWMAAQDARVWVNGWRTLPWRMARD